MAMIHIRQRTGNINMNTVIQKRFEIFLSKIKLSKKQRDDARTKYNGVCKKLHDHYYPDISYTGKTKLLIGSYGKKTNVRPPRDVDVIFMMPPDLYGKYHDNTSNAQSKLLQDVRKILGEKYTTTEKISGWGKVLLIEFSDGTHDVELLPAWEKENSTFIIPNSEDGGHWEVWDPRSEIKKIDDSNAIHGNTKTLIRFIKKWTDNCSVAIKSYQIENFVVGFFGDVDYSDEYSLLVSQFFEYMNDHIGDGDVKSHVQTALKRSIKARAYEEKKKYDDAVKEWGKIFGTLDFPVGAVKLDVGMSFDEKISDLMLQYPEANEQFLLTAYGIDIRIDHTYKISIDAYVQQDGFRKGLLTDYIKNKVPLAKEKELTFTVRHNIPQPYTIMWKVRNFGEEAKMKGDLRGEISADRGYENKIENTRYTGEHYVECYVVKDGYCVAKNIIFVPIT